MKKILYIFLILIGCQESKNNDWFQRLLGTWKSPSRSITFFEDGTFVDSVFSGQDILSIVSGEFSINERNIVTIDSGIFLVNNVSELSGLQYRSMQVELADDSLYVISVDILKSDIRSNSLSGLWHMRHLIYAGQYSFEGIERVDYNFYPDSNKVTQIKMFGNNILSNSFSYSYDGTLLIIDGGLSNVTVDIQNHTMYWYYNGNYRFGYARIQ